MLFGPPTNPPAPPPNYYGLVALFCKSVSLILPLGGRLMGGGGYGVLLPLSKQRIWSINEEPVFCNYMV